jgi:hypothetical protein
MTTPHMRLIPLACMIALLGVMHEVYAFCVPGTIDACFLNGKQGTRTCMSNGFFGPCQIPADPPPPSGTAQPKYKILTVIYAPPGTQGGGSTSSVAYGSGSTVGSTVSVSETFKQNYAVSVSAKAGFLGDGGEIGGSFSYGRNSSEFIPIYGTRCLRGKEPPRGLVDRALVCNPARLRSWISQRDRGRVATPRAIL